MVFRLCLSTTINTRQENSLAIAHKGGGGRRLFDKSIQGSKERVIVEKRKGWGEV